MHSPHRLSRSCLPGQDSLVIRACRHPAGRARRPRRRPVEGLPLLGNGCPSADLRRSTASLPRHRPDDHSLPPDPGRPAAGAGEALSAPPHFFWMAARQSLSAMMALADAVVVTADSVNMLGEAAATDAPFISSGPPDGHPRSSDLSRPSDVRRSSRKASTRSTPRSYEPLDATPAIAAEMLRRYSEHRRRLGLPPDVADET